MNCKKFLLLNHIKLSICNFAKLYRYTNQTLRDVNNKFRNIKKDFEDNDIKREKVIVIINC